MTSIIKPIQPNLFIPGAAKSGTSSLHELLNQHPDICMSSVKEPIFWNTSSINYQRKIEKYNDLFENKKLKILGESTTSYMYYYEFISQVKSNYKILPKLIFILRNPIDRCHSHYWWMVGRGQEKKTFEKCVLKDMNRPFKKYGYVPDYYYHFGLYGFWLKKFYDIFGESNIKIITLEQLKEHREKVINECFSFLELPKLNHIPKVILNKTSKLKHPNIFHFIKKTASGKYRYTKIAKYFLSTNSIDAIRKKLQKINYFSASEKFDYSKISDENRKWLQSIYKEDVSFLKKLTGLKFKEWTDFNN